AETMVDTKGAKVPKAGQLRVVGLAGAWVDVAHHHEEVLIESAIPGRQTKRCALEMAGRQTHHDCEGSHRANDASIHLISITMIDVAASFCRDGVRLVADIAGQTRHDNRHHWRRASGIENTSQSVY